MKLKIAAVMTAATMILAGSQCEDQADTANRNLSTAADNFEILRKIVFYNTRLDIEVVEVTGFCSIEDKTTKLWATCKEPDGIKRHSMGRSNDLTYFAVQQDSADVSLFHTRIVWKPQGFIPDFDVKVDLSDIPESQ